MTRFGIVFWLIVVVIAGFSTFKAKYAIQDLEEELTKVRKQTVVEQKEIRVLTAEWTYLNQPERLADLNKRFLSLVPVAAQQLQQRIEDVPMRPEPPETLVAAAAPQPVSEMAAAAPAAVAPDQTAATKAPAAPARPAASPPPVAVAVAAPAAPVRTTPAVVRNPTPVAAAVKPAVHVQLAKAGPASLDALIARIAEVR